MCRKSFRVFSAALMSNMEHCMRGCTALGTICITLTVHYMEVCRMANIKSAKKRILTSAKKTAANKAVKSSVKTAIKKVNKAVEAGDKAAATAALIAAEARGYDRQGLHKGRSSQEQRVPQGLPSCQQHQQDLSIGYKLLNRLSVCPRPIGHTESLFFCISQKIAVPFIRNCDFVFL